MSIKVANVLPTTTGWAWARRNRSAQTQGYRTSRKQSLKVVERAIDDYEATAISIAVACILPKAPIPVLDESGLEMGNLDSIVRSFRNCALPLSWLEDALIQVKLGAWSKARSDMGTSVVRRTKTPPPDYRGGAKSHRFITRISTPIYHKSGLSQIAAIYRTLPRQS